VNDDAVYRQDIDGQPVDGILLCHLNDVNRAGRKRKMDEVYPIVMGIVFGALYATDIGWFKSWWLRMPLTQAIGVSATVFSGEYRDNWGFVIVDIGEVAVFAWMAFYFTKRLRQHLAAKSRPQGDTENKTIH
jgi:hypothetical protein